ncbi:FG-GAP repeat protein [Haliangium ochraceum]|uniref:Integrin alpha beta-propellor repeat protein n=1 Tax=Haliangium ochraceum (strain DSM 14365 / JCM 11303 / SMP-2) TaxID=502025 RepID=D0LUN9_HALO1|nr:FG-GAP repeat protein [Haliangium ochraceum]ACY13929.1 Integrin alpha beta-propellor repeat protein [Haliangium ochraceum DSM 14365]
MNSQVSLAALSSAVLSIAFGAAGCHNQPVAPSADAGAPTRAAALELSLTLSQTQPFAIASLVDDDIAAVVLTIEDASGSAAYAAERVDLVRFGDDFLSQPLSLVPGDYTVTQLLVIDSSDEVRYATPVAGSAKAHLVADPLPLPFSVAVGAVTTLRPGLLDTEAATAEDFGYLSFGLDDSLIVDAFDVLLAVFAFDQDAGALVPSTADLVVENDAGETLFAGPLSASVQPVSLPSGEAEYVVRVTRAGFAAYEERFTETELAAHFDSAGQGPLEVVLLPSSPFPDAYVKASNTDSVDLFGYSVAFAGDVLAIGAPEEDSAATGVDGDQTDNSLAMSGAVYVFRRNGASWQQEAYLKASNTGLEDRFGDSLALSGDTLAVGASFEASAATGVNGDQADDSRGLSGAVYVFRYDGASWQQEAYLKASNTGSNDQFGFSLALSGEVLAVGAYNESSAATGVDGDQSDNAAIQSGAVYVFRRVGALWQQEAYLKASNTGAGDGFGGAMSLSGDTLAVSAVLEASAATGVGGDQGDDSATSSGAVYIFRHTGGLWQQEAYLKASNTGAGDLFGGSLSLAGDTLAVGTSSEASASADPGDDTAPRSGAVYIFERSGTSWAQERYIKAAVPEADDFFGSCVALSAGSLAVAAKGESSAATGIDGDRLDNSAVQSGAVFVIE